MEPTASRILYVWTTQSEVADIFVRFVFATMPIPTVNNSGAEEAGNPLVL